MQSPSNRRRRGILLTPSGLRKLQQAIDELEYNENFGEKFTLEALSERTRLDPVTIAKVLEAQDGVDKRTLERFFQAIHLELDSSDYLKPLPRGTELQNGQHSPAVVRSTNPKQELAEAVDVSVFYSRTEELGQLERWILRDRCRLVAVLGMGGMGKTALSVKFAQQMYLTRERSTGHRPQELLPRFDYILWKSLRNAPAIEALLATAIQFFSDHQESVLPSSACAGIERLLYYLRQHRCLLILDNVESILKSGSSTGYCCEGYEPYGELFKRVGETHHQSCLLLTSREKPRELALLEGERLCVRSLQLRGLGQAEGRAILKTKGEYVGTDAEWRMLVEHYAGNPLALKMVAPVLQLFGTIAEFLEFLQRGNLVFEDISDLLERQFERLSTLEQEVMYWLAINRKDVSLAELRDDLLPPVAERRLLEAVISLEWRSLIERVSINAAPVAKPTTLFTLQPVVMEYVTHRLIEQMCREIQAGQLEWFHRHALLKATASESVRETQARLILQPIINRLLGLFHTPDEIEALFTRLWEESKSKAAIGYTEKNMLDLLDQLRVQPEGNAVQGKHLSSETATPAPASEASCSTFQVVQQGSDAS